MSPVDDHYPVDCPFCRIAKAYPPDSQCLVPTRPDPDKISPQCHLVLSTPYVLAFLDIMPISPGHLLLIPRQHHEKTSSMYKPAAASTWSALREADEARITAQKMGEYIPLISRALATATEVEDWNIVQNNGHRAAQVVPHVHFHFIPRYQEGRLEREGRLGKVDVGALKSWRMFGRGQRQDLDDDEAAELSEKIRIELRKELVEFEQHSSGTRSSTKL